MELVKAKHLLNSRYISGDTLEDIKSIFLEAYELCGRRLKLSSMCIFINSSDFVGYGYVTLNNDEYYIRTIYDYARDSFFTGEIQDTLLMIYKAANTNEEIVSNNVILYDNILDETYYLHYIISNNGASMYIYGLSEKFYDKVESIFKELGTVEIKFFSIEEEDSYE